MQLDYRMEGEMMKRIADAASLAAMPSQIKEWFSKFSKQLTVIDKFSLAREASYYDL